MKKIILLFSLSIFFLMNIKAQNVGINSSGAAPDGSAMLDVVATDKGVLIPRVDISDLTTEAPVTSATTSLLVYNTNTTTGPGYFYWDGSIWVKLFDNNDGKPWRLLGNAGTVAGTNFLGTTDAVDLVFKANNIEQARILSGAEQGIGIPNSLSIWGRNNADDAWIRAILPAYTDDDIYIGSGNNPSGTNIHLDAGGISNTALFVKGDNGYVGIGTTSPYQKLQVTDDILIGAPSDGSSSADGNAEGVKIWNDNSAWFFGVDRSNDEGDTQTDENFFIGHNDDSDNEGIFNIQYSGNIGMGTTSPGYPLTVTSPTANITGAFFNTEASTDNFAVYGDATTTDYYGYGGYFISGYIGAYGRVNPTGSGSYTGVRGYVYGGSGNNYGFRGYAYGSGTNFGVYGTSAASGTGWVYGVYGYSSGASATNIGLSGSVSDDNGFGIIASNNDANGTAIVAIGNNISTFLYPPSGGGIAANGVNIGVYGYGTETGNDVWGGYFSAANNTDEYAYVGGNFGGTNYKINGPGSVSTIVKRPNGTRANLFCPEAPEILFQDYGTAKLINGQANITLDPILAKNIIVNSKHPLRVFIQLEGDCKGVYVTNKTQNGFDVIELQGGASNVYFSWFITANRADTYDNQGNIISKNADVRFPDGPESVINTVKKIEKLKQSEKEIEKH